ncbi:hypothetical protein FACS1894109_02640 [Spirochaetia bacterium]|nr:hypothetical protein FACS1894109_02640 [Spirochaetia bacterium]
MGADAAPDASDTARLIGKIRVADLISKVYPLKDVAEATEAALSGSTYRVLLKLEE